MTSAANLDSVIRAARLGDAGLVRNWLESGANPNQYDAHRRTPLLAAVVRGRADVVRELLFGVTPAHVGLTFPESDALPINWEIGRSSTRKSSKLRAGV